jgi:peptide/nickel transport system permease protein
MADPTTTTTRRDPTTNADVLQGATGVSTRGVGQIGTGADLVDETGPAGANRAILYDSGELSETAQRNFLRQALHDTFNQTGAKFGAVWILLIAICAVIAPFMASSHPILMKADQKWSSPMWSSLTPADLTLAVVGIATFVLWATKRATFGTGLVVIVAVVAVIGPLAYIFKSTPSSFNYQHYRDLERQGRVQSMLRTLIPYSPTDRMRDMPERRLTPPMAARRQGVVTAADGQTARGIIDVQKDLVVVKTPTGDRVLEPAQVKQIQRDPAPLLSSNWLGTETDGADLLSRMLHATRIALSIGLISTSISITIGIIIGGLMGYFVGKVDLFGMRLIEIFQAIPTLLVLITVMTAWGERNIYVMMVTIGLLSWTGTARFIRAEFLRLREQDFVHAAVAAGLPQWMVIYRHILPNGLTPVLVTATFGVAAAILLESTLSFLGLGLIDEPSWGQMLNQARSGGQGFVWWMAIFPGAAIFLTVYAYALIGDAVRDAIDPKLRKRD